MTSVDWRSILGWSDAQLDELRMAGFSFLREGHYQRALLFFEALAILDPKSVYDIQMVGALYLQNNEGERALTFCDRALALDPLHEPTLLNKVKALLTLNRKEEALQLAHTLTSSKDSYISQDAAALLLAYR